jgi:serine/threonine protein kinase
MFAKDLVKKILTLDPGKRLTIPKILKHPWFKQNKVGLGMSSPSKPSEKMDRYDTDQKEDFKHYV